MLKIVYMGTPEIASTILTAIHSAGYKPSLVVTQPAKPQGRGHKIEKSHVAKTSEKLGIPCVETDNASSGSALEAIRAANPDLILVVAFGQILKENLLSLPKIACLNVHASLLPKYRGAAPVQRAIWNGDLETGVAIQKMVRKLDAGDILHVKTTPIKPTETSGELLARLSVLGGEGLVESLQLIESGKFQFSKQDESKVTVAAKISKDEAKIDWKKPSDFIYNQIRALQPWPVAESVIEGVRVKVFKAEVVDRGAKAPIQMQCGDGKTLSILELQPENRKRMSAAEFLSGRK